MLLPDQVLDVDKKAKELSALLHQFAVDKDIDTDGNYPYIDSTNVNIYLPYYTTNNPEHYFNTKFVATVEEFKIWLEKENQKRYGK